MVFPILGSGDSSSGFNIDNSSRFNGTSSIMSKTFGSAGNRRTFTISCWVKKCKLVANQFLFFSGAGATYGDLHFKDNDQLQFASEISGSGTVYNLVTNRKFRDPSAWYHIVIGVNTTLGTAASRVDFFINGVEETSFATETYPSQNLDTTWSNSVSHEVGAYDSSQTASNFFSGYIADFHFIDGTYDSGSGGDNGASPFGEVDEDSGIWKPKKYSGAYGTNGFFLEFKQTGDSANASGYGADTSGNGNHLGINGFGPHQKTTDTPTNNFCTMDPLSEYGITFTNGNLGVQGASNSGYSVATANMEVPKLGKWYYEVEVDVMGGTNHEYLGIKRDDLKLQANAYDLHSSTCQLYQSTDGSNGAFRDESSTTATATALRHSAGDIIMVAIDQGSDKMWFGKNGTWYDDDATTDGDPANGTNPTCTPNNAYTWHIFSGGGANEVKYLYNFGNPPFTISSGNSDAAGYGNFEYAVPSGFYALCTKNIATYDPPTIDDGSAYFQTASYTGNATNRTITNDGNSDLQPDLVWFKNRTGGGFNHYIYNSTTGVGKNLRPDIPDAEGADAGQILAFNSDGFNLKNSGATNGNGNGIVAWQWNANDGTTSSNTDGSATSTLQVNSTSKFSIITFNSATNGTTFGHGLGVKPGFAMLKDRESGSSWYTFFPIVQGSNQSSAIDGTGAFGTVSGFSDFSTSLFTVGTAAGNDQIAFMWGNVQGYSKAGQYPSNDNADGPMVYTGFSPAWIILKNVGAGTNWRIYDRYRDGYNGGNQFFEANSGDAEDSATSELDFCSNGFKLVGAEGDINYNADTIDYFACARNPFVTSTGIPATAI